MDVRTETSAREISLVLTPEFLLQQRVQRQAFLDFVQLFRQTLQKYFAALPNGPGFDLQVACALAPGRRSHFQIDARPAEHLAMLLAELRRQLEGLPVPI